MSSSETDSSSKKKRNLRRYHVWAGSHGHFQLNVKYITENEGKSIVHKNVVSFRTCGKLMWSSYRFVFSLYS